jgi:hypothetical protein
MPNDKLIYAIEDAYRCSFNEGMGSEEGDKLIENHISVLKENKTYVVNYYGYEQFLKKITNNIICYLFS